MSIVLAENLTRRFGSLTAVNKLNLEIAEGEIFALVGPDGAGKTTTMRLLCGLMDPTEGRAEVAGMSVTESHDEVKDQIGYMAQRFGLYGDLTVAENMTFYADLFGILGKEREDLSSELLRMTRMEPFRKRQAAKRADVHAATQAARAVSGRAHQRRGPGVAARLLGHPLSVGAGGTHGDGDYGVSR